MEVWTLFRCGEEWPRDWTCSVLICVYDSFETIRLNNPDIVWMEPNFSAIIVGESEHRRFMAERILVVTQENG